jgi:Putative addiction module component
MSGGMNERVKKLSEEIRKLSPEEQADLMDELLVLTYQPADAAVEKAWSDEIGRRISEVRRGEAKLIDAREALRKYKTP